MLRPYFIICFLFLWKLPQVPGFRNFVIEKFASNCCFDSVLDKSFELRDANTVSLHCFELLFFVDLLHNFYCVGDTHGPNYASPLDCMIQMP